jgi:hypothetical protein
MKSLENLNQVPMGRMLLADDITDFHASRILLLIFICGKEDTKSKQIKIDSLTKLAKLDFFIRYPAFFERVTIEHTTNEPNTNKSKLENKSVESKMVRFHYGPWDNRYYQVLPFLEARNLITIEKDPNHNNFIFYLSEYGKKVATDFKNDNNFNLLVNRITDVNKSLGNLSGNKLKLLIYDIFKEEVTDKSLGEIIEQ